MKTAGKILAVIAAAALFFAMTPALPVSADPGSDNDILDPNAVTILGKASYERHAGFDTATFTYGASGFTANFVGTEFFMYVPEVIIDNGNVRDVYVGVLVDTDMPMEAKMVSVNRTGWVTLASGLENTRHTITVRKQSRGFYGVMASDWFCASAVGTDGSFLTPDQRSDFVIEVFGDSITNGDATWLNEDNSNSAWTWASYSGAVCRLLGAEARICGNTGNGLLGWVMAQQNGQLDNLFPPQASWNVVDPNHGGVPYAHGADNQTDVAIINVGTNDRIELSNGDMTDTMFEDEYIRFIKQMKTDCPNIIVIATVGAMGELKGDGYEVDFGRICDECNSWAGEEFVWFTALANCSGIPNGVGYDNGHPSNTAHEIYALQIASIINEKLSLGVELPAIESSENPNLAVSHYSSYSSKSNYSDGTKTPDKAFDADTSTYWQPHDDDKTDSWIGIELDGIYDISRVTVMWKGINSNGSTSVLVSTDGVSWNTVASGIGTVTDSTETADFASVQAKYVRLENKGSSSEKNGPEILEIGVFSRADAAAEPEVSRIAAQRSSDSSRLKVRFIAAADVGAIENGVSFKYKSVGFEVTAKDNVRGTSYTKQFKGGTVYDEIASASASDFGVTGGKLFCFTLEEVSRDCVIEIRAFVIDQDDRVTYSNNGRITTAKITNGVLTVRN